MKPHHLPNEGARSDLRRDPDLAAKRQAPVLAKLHKLYANFVALGGRCEAERREIREVILHGVQRERCDSDDTPPVASPCTDLQAAHQLQNSSFPGELRTAHKLIVLAVPQCNVVCGGICSIFSIADQMRRLKRHHGSEVVVVTLPGEPGTTYFRNTQFRNAENVFRFEQLLHCCGVEDLYLHLPEYAASTFVDQLSEKERGYLAERHVHINILNQNIKLMPPREAFANLHELAETVTQSVAHHAYFNQEVADRFGLPTLMLPAYADLTPYPQSTFAEKEKLIIYSPDEAPYKAACLDRIARELPEFKLVEIRGITFEHFMDLATRCMFSVTFGEGFDYYLIQPTCQGGIGLAAFNDDFFPASDFKQYENIFKDADQMVEQIGNRIRWLSADEQAYKSLNARFVARYDELYSRVAYIAQIKKLTLREFEIFPRGA